MRLIHLTDFHLTPSVTDEDICRVREAMERFHPDYVITTGDLASRDTLDRMKIQWDRAHKLLDGFRVFSVPGNHDVYDSGFNNIAADFKPRAENLEGCYLVGLNSAVQRDQEELARIADVNIRKALQDKIGHIRRGDIEMADFASLDQLMGAYDRDDFRILCLHHHLLPIYNEEFKTSYNFDIVSNAADILELLQKHQFDLVLNGHKHCLKLNVMNNTIHLTGGAVFAPVPSGQNCFNVIDIGNFVQIRAHYIQAKFSKVIYYSPNQRF